MSIEDAERQALLHRLSGVLPTPCKLSVVLPVLIRAIAFASAEKLKDDPMAFSNIEDALFEVLFAHKVLERA